MVSRALLSIWFLVASVFAPAFCCCAPFALRSTAHADTPRASAPPASAAKKPCSHCERTAPAKDGATKEKQPCPANPGRDHCPCQDHVVASSVPDSVNWRAVQLNNWVPDFPPFVAFTFARHVLADGEPRRADYTGPPPPSGIELLHRLHILIC
jgi:hypothetical protein